ncbi:phosphogluconate dehydrogenase (NAD(+)-dependent, decarboxylating) [Enterococcus rotai]|uniref:phosphogluconate dehydrogenase (NAD(+)-dependent, decarboxylating) n=1 Tax=Enterococcus rotai TaxID=118060 RepID=UPI0032B37DEE
MDIALIGLGKMGLGIAENLSQKEGYQLSGMDLNQQVKSEFEKQYGAFYSNIDALFSEKKSRRIVWIMLPAGETTNNMVKECCDKLGLGDIIIDAGNSKYLDSKQNFDYCQKQGIHFLDVGTSGGMEGARNGACMMVGGEELIFKELEGLFADLCVENGYLYCGSAGSGHYLKMVHNGIEYGMMQSIGEGFNVLHHSPYDYQLEEVAKVFNHGSVIRSWLMELTENLFKETADFSAIAGIIPSSGEGKWTVEEALRLNLAIPVITQSLMTRYSSSDNEKINEKVIALLRNQFGGHAFVKEE